MRWLAFAIAAFGAVLGSTPIASEQRAAIGATTPRASPGLAWADGPRTLTNVEILARDHRCGRQRWECGSRAADIVDRELRAWETRCRPNAHQDTVTRCGNGLRNLAKWLVAEGWAVPRPDAMGEYGVELLAAKKARRGMWGGGGAELALYTVPERSMPKVRPASDSRR